MISSFAFSAVPAWAWLLLLLLLALGLRATRTRDVPAIVVYGLPALGLITFSSLLRLPQPLLVFGTHGAGYLAGGLVGFAVQGRWILEKRRNSARMSGEWLTMTMMMALFGANFVNGTLAAVAPQWPASPLYLTGFALLTGLASGTFAGRAVRLAATPLTVGQT